MGDRRGRRQLFPPRASLAELISNLSRKRQEIVRPVLENPREFVLLTVRAMAKRLKTDPATTVRIVRGMGFQGYKQFQTFLHELSITHATSLETMQAVPANQSKFPANIRRSLDQDIRNLQALRNSLEAKRVVSLARRMYAARRILLIGGDLAASLVNYLEHHLALLGFPVVTATTAGMIAHLARTTGKRDLVFAMSFGRGLRQTVEGMQQARANGAHCVGITDTFLSPVARFSDECFLASTATPSFGDSYVAPMALFDAILMACANYRRARTLAWLKKADQEERLGFRWFDS
jgi:DNA-binding MurR/RpiR family transcriptional regulator